MFKTINGGRLPQRATRYSAGFDVFANEDVVIGAGETVTIGLGIALDEHLMKESLWSLYLTNANYEDFMSKHYLELHPRSSLRAKGLGGGVGIIDMDFRDEIKMVITNMMTSEGAVMIAGLSFLMNYSMLMNMTEEQIRSATDIYMEQKKGNEGSFTIKRGEKIGQLILKRHEGWLLPSEYTKDEERNGGFGSSGVV